MYCPLYLNVPIPGAERPAGGFQAIKLGLSQGLEKTELKVKNCK